VSLDEFMAAHPWETLEAANGWRLRRDGDRIEFDLTARDGEAYTARLLCDNYPRAAPSVVFVDAQGSPSGSRAWPKGNGRFFEVVKPPPNCFLCMPLTREGLAHHSDWLRDPAKKPWDAERSTLMDVFNYLQRLLSGPDYTGRGP
jgi:hypothetical protein